MEWLVFDHKDGIQTKPLTCKVKEMQKETAVLLLGFINKGQNY